MSQFYDAYRDRDRYRVPFRHNHTPWMTYLATEAWCSDCGARWVREDNGPWKVAR